MRRLLLALAPVALLLTAPWADQPAAASCAGPTIVTDEALVPGTTTEVVGMWFTNAPCDDTGTGGCEDDQEPDRPRVVAYQDVVLTLVQGGRTWELATADADSSGDLSWTAAVPADLAPGHARLETEYGAFRVQVG